MKQHLRLLLSGTVGFGLLVGLVYLVYVGAREVLTAVRSFDSDISVAIIAAAATAFVSVLSIVLGKVYESRSHVQKELREKKTPVYEKLIAFMTRVLLGSKTGNAPDEREIIQFLVDFTQQLTVWGSDEVLAAWVSWRRVATNQAYMTENPVELMFLYERLILTIRRDLGHKNKGISRGDVLATFVNDIDKYLPGKST